MVSTSEATSLSLLERIQHTENNRDWDFFVSIYEPFFRRHLTSLGIRPADLDDLLQDTMATVIVALPNFRHNGRIGAFRKWLKTIVFRRAIAFQQKLQRRKSALQHCREDLDDLDRSMQEAWDREHDEYILNCLLEKIRPEFTATVWMAFEQQIIDGETASDVAQRLDCTTNAVLLSKSRVLRRLRQIGKGLIEC